jgi:hypothetical protein
VYQPKAGDANAQKVGADLASLATEARTFMANVLGPAPSSPIQIVGVRRAGGFASGGTILIDDSVFRRGRLDSQNAMIVAESVAKMWIGSSIYVTGDGAGVVREGLARYIATQFLENKFGKDIADLERQRQRVAYAAISRRDSPLTVVSPFDDYYYPAVANKGAMAWRILAKKIGNDEFYKAIRSATQDGTVSLAEVRAQFAADKDLLDYLFDQVTDTNLLAGLPQTGGAETRVALRNTGPIDVTVNVAAWAANGERMSAPTTIRAKSFGEISFKTASKPVKIEIDPEKFYPQSDYSDDIAPRESTDSDVLIAVKRAFDKQEFASAEKISRDVLRDQPRFDDVRVLLGRALLAQSRNAGCGKGISCGARRKASLTAKYCMVERRTRRNRSEEWTECPAAKYASDAIIADAEYGASLAARAIRNRTNAGSASDESVKSFFASFDKAAASNRKTDLDALSIPSEVSKFVGGISGQTVEWKTNVLHVDPIDANNVWVEASLAVRLLNRDPEKGTAVYRLTRVGGGWKLAGVDIFEVR